MSLIKTKAFPNICSICSHRVKEKKSQLSFPAVHLQPARTGSLEPCKHPDVIGESLHIKSFENSSIGRESNSWVFNTYRQNYCLGMRLPFALSKSTLLYIVMCGWLRINHYCLWHLPLNIMTFSPSVKAKLNSPGRCEQHTLQGNANMNYHRNTDQKFQSCIDTNNLIVETDIIQL